MKRILYFIALCAIVIGMSAQTEDLGRQILVFRNTGEVNLFYSNKLDSITTNDTAQVFHSVDTIMVVPFVELDSVTVGSRNEIVVNKKVRQLTNDADIPWLIRTEGNSLFYRKDTPTNILPKADERLYYAESCQWFPYGLAGKVLSVNLKNGEYEVVVGDVDLSEIFDRLFYAGRMQSQKNANEVKLAHRAPLDIPEGYVEPVPMEGILDLGNHGEISVNGETNITADFVVNVQRKYYHANIHINTEIGFDFMLRSNDSFTDKSNTPNIEFPLPVIAGVLHPVFYVNLFCEIAAELRFNFAMKRNWAFEYEWTRENGQNSFVNKTPTGRKHQYEDEAKMDILLNGEVYAGATLGLGLNLVGDRVGFRASVQAGPYLNGELGVGMLTNLRNYNPEYFHNAEMNLGLRLRLAASVFDHEYFWLWGDEVEHPLYSHDFNLFHTTLPLFPQYERSCAVAQVNTERQTEVTMATTVPEPTPTALETGFELVDANGEVVDSVYVGTIQPMQETIKAQYFDTERTLPEEINIEALESYKARPIFHYAGYTISGEPIGIRKDVNLQPYTSQQSNGVMSFVSSGPFLGSAKQNETLYMVGSYLPVPPKKRLKDEP